MAIKSKCGNCSKEFYAAHELMGAYTKCPGCGGPVAVPKVNATVVRFDDEPAPFAPATAKQVSYLRSLGVDCARGTSMEDATELIRQALSAREIERKQQQQ
jgi:DNA-directed RNA polymerase subunit RPC12/RpoP